MLNAKDQFTVLSLQMQTACTCFQPVHGVLGKCFEKKEIKDMFKTRNAPRGEPISDSIRSNLLMTPFSLVPFPMIKDGPSLMNASGDNNERLLLLSSRLQQTG